MKPWLVLLACVGLWLPAVAESRPWRTLTGCVWVDHPNNDGDSFRVRWGTNEFTVRLIGVDCPETTTKASRARRQRQADALGVSLADARAVGQRMAATVREQLSAAPFTVQVRGDLRTRGRLRAKVWLRRA